MRHRPTLEDVARLSGVSTATVSRVLNDSSLVQPVTREKVETAVARLGYTPHFAGRALASNRTQTIGAVVPTMENAIFARGLQALEEALAMAGVTLLVATSHYNPVREAEQIRVLLARGVDGLVLIGEARDAATYAFLQRHAVPFVLLWTWRQGCRWPCIGFDNAAAARMMAERIIALGHRRIAMIAGLTSGNDRAAARVMGVREALRAAGMGLDPDRLIEAEYTLDAGREAASRLLRSRSKPTVIICGNDVLAAGAMIAIREAGLAIPADISVTGFDDIDLARALDPPLTTIHVPHRRMGQAAAEMLLRRDEPDLESIVFQTELVERGSLGRVSWPSRRR